MQQFSNKCYNCLAIKRSSIGHLPICNCGLPMFRNFSQLNNDKDKKEWIKNRISEHNNSKRRHLAYANLDNTIKNIIYKDMQRWFPTFKVHVLYENENYFPDPTHGTEKEKTYYGAFKFQKRKIYKVDFLKKMDGNKAEYFIEALTITEAKNRFLSLPFSKFGNIQMIEEIYNYLYKENLYEV